MLLPIVNAQIQKYRNTKTQKLYSTDTAYDKVTIRYIFAHIWCFKDTKNDIHVLSL